MTQGNAAPRPRAASPYVVLAGEGQPLRGPAGGQAHYKARAETTNGTFTALENVIAPHQGPPLHLHAREDEMYYVIDGLLRFEAGETAFDAPSGSFVFIPRATPHRFQNVTDDPTRLLVMFTPAGMERFFDGQALLPPGPPDPATWGPVARDGWMELLGPPMPPPRR